MLHTNTGCAHAASDGDADLAVVGGGILGLAVARELLERHPRLRITVLEREAAIASHQTAHNSGVLHAGIYYAPGSLKARLCVEGAAAMAAFCERHDLPFERSGKVIVARDRAELPALDELARRGRANGVEGLRRLDAAGIEALEPHCRGVAGLHSPATGIVDFAAVAGALAGELEAGGATVVTGAGVDSVGRAAGGRLALRHARGELRARFAVFCAGGSSDWLAAADGAGTDPRIVPFRGAYLRLRTERRELVRSLIYPVPNPALPFLGVHLTRTVGGDVLLGPTALPAPGRRPRDLAATLAWPGTWRMARRWWRAGATELHHAVSRRALVAAAAEYVPVLGVEDVEPAFAGVRAQALGRDGRLVDDFVVHETEHALHVRNAPSPAATSALALARLIADRAEPGLE